MPFELALCEQALLTEIADKSLKRGDIALTYRLAMASSERDRVDWAKVNRAIIQRWSKAGLTWIKKEAWRDHA